MVLRCLVEDMSNSKGFGLFLIPQSGDNTPVAGVLFCPQVTHALGTAAKDFDRPDDMLDEDTDFTFEAIGLFLSVG